MSLSKVDLVLLGLLMEKPRHGYDIQQQIKNRHMENWAGISTPSIYQGLSRLEAKKALVSRSEDNQLRPSRTVYEITDLGRAMVPRLVREALGGLESRSSNLMTGIGFSHLLDREGLVEELGNRKRQLVDHLDYSDQVLSELEEIKHCPVTADRIIDYFRRLIHMELEWIDDFLQMVESDDSWPEGIFKR